MTIFGTLQTTRSGLHVYRTWLDAVSDNVANMDTVRRTNEEAFRARYVIASQAGTQLGDGAKVTGIALGNAQGRLVHDPSHPLADADGMVRYPDIDLAEQMVQLMQAQRGYQANLSVLDRAREAYSQALTIGRPQ